MRGRGLAPTPLSVWRGDSLTRVVVRDGFAARGRLAAGVPAPFRDAWRALTAYRPAGAVEWQPSTIEVAAWPYEYAPDDPPDGPRASRDPLG